MARVARPCTCPYLALNTVLCLLPALLLIITAFLIVWRVFAEFFVELMGNVSGDASLEAASFVEEILHHFDSRVWYIGGVVAGIGLLQLCLCVCASAVGCCESRLAAGCYTCLLLPPLAFFVSVLILFTNPGLLPLSSGLSRIQSGYTSYFSLSNTSDSTLFFTIFQQVLECCGVDALHEWRDLFANQTAANITRAQEMAVSCCRLDLTRLQSRNGSSPVTLLAATQQSIQNSPAALTCVLSATPTFSRDCVSQIVVLVSRDPTLPIIAAGSFLFLLLLTCTCGWCISCSKDQERVGPQPPVRHRVKRLTPRRGDRDIERGRRRGSRRRRERSSNRQRRRRDSRERSPPPYEEVMRGDKRRSGLVPDTERW